ncbi:MAG TPA: hypothetical protein VK639_07900 [Terriglobales bacterium]|nr:hypothetical protein [Terriglobales bacterium]
MFDRLKQLFQKPTPKESWQETLRRIGKELVPVSGEAETLQGEMVRCISNLKDEATRNGWMNWDQRDAESIEVLRRYLPDTAVFSEPVRQEIHKALDTVRYAGERGADEGVFGYNELKFLAKHVAEWCIHYDDLTYKHPEATWLDEDPFKQPGNA